MENNTISVTKGDIESEFKNKDGNTFYEKIAEKSEDEYTALKYGNKNIYLDTESSKKAMARVIGGVLCTDLAIVSEKAENANLN